MSFRSQILTVKLAAMFHVEHYEKDTTLHGRPAMTKQRRYLISAGVLAVCVCVVLVVLALLPPRTGVTKANFDRIQDGMSIAEVELILGGAGQPFHGFANQKQTLVWLGDDGSLAFVEVADNSVKSKMWNPSNETFADKLRRWLRLPK